MTLDQYIAELQKLRDEHGGEIEAVSIDGEGEIIEAKPYVKHKDSKYPSCLWYIGDPVERLGERVILV